MSISIKINPAKWKKDLLEGLKGAFGNSKRLISTSVMGLSVFFLTVFSTSPEYSIQMLAMGVDQWWLAFLTRFSSIYASSGFTAIILTILFSILVGVTMTNTLVQLKNNKLSFDSLGALPGFVAGGCASCGVGLLSLFGLGGVLTTVPFAGNLLRLGAVILLIVLIVRTGNPDVCKLK